ncbi:hypothetical protein HNQ92_002379 [Rhabdobacter roseus]|uniref:Class I SAM-dependent methyltransferase n=1 Tax=Rhabdobacter roseus TaxID=1655419 RepID=A0A840TJ63_9BACT|nr:hypothetical protein [Rhabdobacter roseus]MBB5284236.1 hypothetical protein [Rhabdobacter roseus]
MKNIIKSKRDSLLKKILGLDINIAQESLAYQKISKLSNSLNKVYPYTSSALSPVHLNLVLNDIIINTRRNIVELGSGISTIIIAKLLQTNSIKAQFTSIEENEDWANYINNCLIEENLIEYCNVMHIPIKKSENYYWYDLQKINIIKQSIGLIDCLIIDGPIAHSKGKENSREKTLYEFYELLDNTKSVFLDDTNRKGEQIAIKNWTKKYNISFINFGNFSIHQSGHHFNIY